MAGSYIIGNVVRISWTVKDISGALIDPATSALTIVRPDNTTVGPFIPVHDSLGTFHYDDTPTALDWHTYHCATTGPTAAGQGSYYMMA